MLLTRQNLMKEAKNYIVNTIHFNRRTSAGPAAKSNMDVLCFVSSLFVFTMEVS